MGKECKLTIHMVMSLDGFIAKKDNSIEWFNTISPYEQGIDFPDMGDFFKSIDCYVMGARTYELAMELSEKYGWPYGEVPTIVISHNQYEESRSHIRFYSGDISTLVDVQLKNQYKNIWLVGGPEVSNQFITRGLADELRLTILPILLGEGLSFFNLDKEYLLNLKEVHAYKTGLVELCYQIRK